MVVLHRITLELTSQYKAVRLQALRDSPTAFCSTYAGECLFSEEEWSRCAQNLNGERAVGYMAFVEDKYCGLVVCFLDKEDAATAHLVSMWVAPEYRRTGAGRLLVNAIIEWANKRGAKTLHLMVTSSNDAATAFYRSLGFSWTGRTEPYPNDAALIEYEMTRPIP